MSSAGSHHYRSLLLSIGLVIAAVLLFCSGGWIVALVIPIAQHFDLNGHVSRPELILRPIYSAALILIAYAGTRQVFAYLTGRSLESTLLGERTQAVSATILVSTFVLVPLFLALYAYAVAHPAFYEAYFYEDKPIENLTPVLCFFGFLLCCLAAVRALRMNIPLPGLIAGAIALLGIGCLFLGLEEISYGQRIFGWSTPAMLAERNLQHESNLHNLLSYEQLDLVEWAGAFVVFLGTMASVILRGAWRHPWAVFLPHETLVFLAAILFMLSSHGSFQEPLENGVALFLLLYSWQLVQVTSSRTPAPQ